MNSYVSTYTKFTRDVGLVSITNLLLAFTGFITLPIVSKTLGASGYGIWAQLIIVLSLVRPLTTLGLPFALVRFPADEKHPENLLPRFPSMLWSIILTSTISNTDLNTWC